MLISDFISIIDGTIYNSTGLYFIVLGIIISIRFTGYPDLTVDGSFTVGAAFYAVTINLTSSVIIALIVALFSGLIAGLLTAMVNQTFNVGKIISSIIVMIILTLVVPYFTSGITISLLNSDSIFTYVSKLDYQITHMIFGAVPFSLHLIFILFFLLLALVLTVFLLKFFTKHKVGIKLRYIGSAKKPGLIKVKYRKFYLFFGLALGNMFVALGGAFEAEKKAGFNQNMGFGVLLIALTILILGESIVKARKKRDFLYVKEYLLAASIGTFIYSLGVQLLLALNISFLDVRLSSTLLLLFLLGYAAKRHPNSAQLF